MLNNNNLLLGSSITKSGLHRGPNTRYILYNDTVSEHIRIIQWVFFRKEWHTSIAATSQTKEYEY